MGSAKVVKGAAIILPCLVVLALIILNIYLYEEYEKLSPGPVSVTVADNKPETVAPALVTAPQTVEANLHAEEIADLKTKLTAIEDELEKADQKWADITEEEKKEEKNQLMAELVPDINIYVNSLAPIFSELKISSEKIAKYRDMCIDCAIANNIEVKYKALNKIKPGATDVRELTEVQKEMFDKEYQELSDKIWRDCQTKYKELLGEDNYAQISEYEKTQGERGTVSNFKSTLGADEMLTKDQEKALIKIIYNEQEKASNEIVRDSSREPSTGITNEMISESMKRQERLHSRMTEGAKDVLSESQLQKFADYLKSQREMNELQLKSFEAVNE